MGFFNDNLNSLMAAQGYNDMQQNKKHNEDLCPSCCTLITSSNNQYYSGLIVPKEFEERILVHVVSHFLTQNDFFVPPMYLAIEGPAGEGKTSQTIAALTQHDMEVIYISASELAGSHERDSVELMDQFYEYAVSRRKIMKCVAILIDDFHMGTVNQDPKIEKTINTNLLTGRMMNLANRNDGIKIPIILTGNDFSNVYAPLLRSGRADRYIWKPDFETKSSIIRTLIEPFTVLSEEEFTRFCNRYRDGSIADFSQLKNDWRKDYVWKLIENERTLNMNAISRLNNYSIRFCKIRYQELCELADRRMKSVKEKEEE